MIYKIFRNHEWHKFKQAKVTSGAPIDIKDGYIHFSTILQADETMAKHFSNDADLWLIACDELQFGDALKWEISRNNQKFPHLYRKLSLSDVVYAEPIENTVTNTVAAKEAS